MVFCYQLRQVVKKVITKVISRGLIYFAERNCQIPIFKEVPELKDCPMHGKHYILIQFIHLPLSYSSFWVTHIIYFDL